VTLEPSCSEGGADAAWLDWYFNAFTEDPALGLTYTQVGQENPFPWSLVKGGFQKQISRLRALQAKGKIRLETLSETGRWFSSRYKRTPPSATSALSDYKNSGRRTLWFNSRHYRANFLWENGKLKIRDIHLFNEDYPSRYNDNPCTTHEFRFFTLPLVDGNLWSTQDFMAGLRCYEADGQPTRGYEPNIKSERDEMLVAWPLRNGQTMAIRCAEDRLELTHSDRNAEWYLELQVARGAELPFTRITSSTLYATQENFDYRVQLVRGSILDLRPQNQGRIFRIVPRNGRIALKMK